MNFTGKDIAIAILVLIVIVMIFKPHMSFASEASEASSLPSGALMPKAAEEKCDAKYGAGWSEFIPTMCKKA